MAFPSEKLKEAFADILAILSGDADLDPSMVLAKVHQAMEAAKGKLRGAETRGDEIWALCPYHDDRTVGSFSVNVSTGRYFCFVCGASGGIRSLLYKLGVDPALIRKLGDSLSPDVLRHFFGGHEEEECSAPLMPVPEACLLNFTAQSKRMLYEKSHRPQVLKSLEVAYDSTHHRIVFPVRTADGKLVGIQSRAAFDDDRLRWKWYTDTEYERLVSGLPESFEEQYVVPRKRVLYAENKVLGAWLASGKVGKFSLVEGPGHCCRSWEALCPSMATFGASFSDSQLERINAAASKLGQRPTAILCFDGDEAGMGATVRAAQVLAKQCAVKVVFLSPGTDPEDYDAKELRVLLDSAMPLSDIAKTDTEDTRRFKVAWLKEVRKASRRTGPTHKNSDVLPRARKEAASARLSFEEKQVPPKPRRMHRQIEELKAAARKLLEGA